MEASYVYGLSWFTVGARLFFSTMVSRVPLYLLRSCVNMTKGGEYVFDGVGVCVCTIDTPCKNKKIVMKQFPLRRRRFCFFSTPDPL